MIKKILLPLFTLSCSAIAMAQSTPYIGGDAGLISLSSGSRGMFLPIFNPSGFNARIFGGVLWGDTTGFQYGLEGAAMYFPHARGEYPVDPFFLTWDTMSYTGYSLSLLGVAKYVFPSGFLILGKAGVAYLYEKTSSEFDTPWGDLPLSNSSGSKVAPEAALGMGYQFKNHWELDLTADSIFAGGAPSTGSGNPVMQTNTLNLGLTYHFA